MFANLANFAYTAYSTLIFRMILRAIKSTLFVRCAAVNWRVAGRTNLKFSKLIKLDIDGIVGVPLALCFGSSGLEKIGFISNCNYRALFLDSIQYLHFPQS